MVPSAAWAPVASTKLMEGLPTKSATNRLLGLLYTVQRGLILLEHAVVDQADLGGQRHGLHLVVGDVDKGGAGLHVQPLKLVAHLQAELRVQVGQRFVHEQHRGLRGQRAGDGHPLLLAAGQLGGIAVHEHADLHDAGRRGARTGRSPPSSACASAVTGLPSFAVLESWSFKRAAGGGGLVPGGLRARPRSSGRRACATVPGLHGLVELK